MTNKVYGIDLGTTYSCISSVDEYGKPVVIPNSVNDTTTPSVVYFESADNIIVGKTAKDLAETYPDQVVSTVKRVMGDMTWVYEYADHTYTPQEISSLILRQLVEDAKAVTGEDIKDVVITVPAYFGVNQKEATKQAGELADLNVLQVIPEPTAAAIAYGMEQKEDQTILVYDLGGGTFDITVIEIKEGAITVICTGGDHQLGGRNWDESIAEYFISSFAEENGVDGQDLMEDKETWQELLNAAEDKKCKLSTSNSIIEKVNHQGDRAKVELSREKFEELTASLLEKTLLMTDSVLQTAAEKGHSKIDRLLMVGGSTYMPQIKEALDSKYPFEIMQFDPNQSVAKGAAIFGHKCMLHEEIKVAIAEQTGEKAEEVTVDEVDDDVLAIAQKQVADDHGMALPGLKKLTETVITNVTSKSFGIVVMDREGEEKVNNLIVIDETVPREITRKYVTHGDMQGGVTLRCMENTQRKGANEHFLVDPEEEIGSAELTFERSLPEKSPVEVTFSLAPDGLLTVHGKDLTTLTEIQAEFKTQSILSKEELQEKKQHNMSLDVSS